MNSFSRGLKWSKTNEKWPLKDEIVSLILICVISKSEKPFPASDSLFLLH